MKLLEVRNLKLEFLDTIPPTQVTKGISFSMGPGEILGIVGESGSGKTQTALSILRLLKKQERIASGEILFQGKNLAELPLKEMEKIRGKEISMIFQEPMTSLNPVLTIGTQIEEGMKLHTKMSAIERKEKALAIMEEAELHDPETLWKQYPHQLSGGMRQRVMIAAALTTEPRLLIADEPTTALDVTIQAQILKLMKKINEKHGTGILFISHDLSLVRRLCSRVIVMKDGRIVEQGAMEDIFENPQQEYTQKLIAAIPRCVKKNSGRSAKTEEAHG